ncbi:MAG: DUF4215 domain-containing protein [Deltaproteobacteria bacterium]|nr:DUF4215 domain-containing protein [Deltaproteobacteria bacterium]
MRLATTATPTTPTRARAPARWPPAATASCRPGSRTATRAAGRSADCDSDCTLAECGDGTINAAAGEDCDDGNQTATDECTNTCKAAACGDGIVQAGVEGCDDGNQTDNDDCSNACEPTLDPQCGMAYTMLTEANRNDVFNDGNAGIEFCDRVGSMNKSPDWQGPGWYRFSGAAGTTMPTSATTDFDCGTDASGWLNGALPSKSDGVVDRVVCFAFFGNPCTYDEDVKVVNCGDFYLFQLPDVPQCSLRYCGD